MSISGKAGASKPYGFFLAESQLPVWLKKSRPIYPARKRENRADKAEGVLRYFFKLFRRFLNYPKRSKKRIIKYNFLHF